MKKKAASLPVDDVIVYCVSCAKAMFNLGKTPHYLIDLIFDGKTVPQITAPNMWHKQLDDIIAQHKKNGDVNTAKKPVPGNA